MFFSRQLIPIVSHPVVITAYICGAFAMYGPAAMSVDLLATFATKSHAKSIERWIGVMALCPVFNAVINVEAADKDVGNVELFKVH